MSLKTYLLGSYLKTNVRAREPWNRKCKNLAVPSLTLPSVHSKAKGQHFCHFK